MTAHITFQATHPHVVVASDKVRLELRDYEDNRQNFAYLSSAEAIALGYALFSIGLTLKGIK